MEEAGDRVAGPLLLLVVGASGSGKTAVRDPLQHELDGVAVHEFDEIGVPSHAMPSWRQRANEEWLQMMVDRDEADRALLLLGQTPLGELLATPSAVHLGGIACCLMDCDDATPDGHVSTSARAGREKRWSGICNGRTGFAATLSIRSGGRR